MMRLYGGLFAALALGATLFADSPLARWEEVTGRASELVAENELEAAEKAYIESIALAEQIADAPERLGASLNSLGTLYFKLLRFDEGVKALRRAVTVLDQSSQPASEQALLVRSNLAALLIGAERFKDARKEVDRLLKVAKYHRDDPRIAKANIQIAQAEQGRGHIELALWHYQWAIERIERHRPNNTTELQTALTLADTLIVQTLNETPPTSALLIDVEFLDPASWLEGRYLDAELGRVLAERAMIVRRRSFGPDSPTTIRNSCTLAAALRRLNRHREAHEVLRASLSLASSHRDLDETAQLPIYDQLAELHAADGETDLAGEALESVVRIHRRAFSQSSSHMRKILGEAANNAKRYGATEAAARFNAKRDEYPVTPWEAAGAKRSDARSARTFKTISPRYPSAASTRRLETTIFLLALVDERGKLGSLHVLEGAGHGFEKSAKAAVVAWRFEPESYNAQPYATVQRVQVNYRLSR